MDGIKNCKQLFSLRLAFTTQKKATHTAEMMPVQFVTIFWVVNASSGEKSCLQVSIPTYSRVGGKGGVSHRLKNKETTIKCIDSTKYNVQLTAYAVGNPRLPIRLIQPTFQY